MIIGPVIPLIELGFPGYRPSNDFSRMEIHLRPLLTGLWPFSSPLGPEKGAWKSPLITIPTPGAGRVRTS
jgi:hypothetical protein